MLEYINDPNDIKQIQPEDYKLLAKDIRRFLLRNVSRTGGHLASNLGIVELTMALHLVLDFPKDQLIFDVGHQSYVHKILTGRKNGFENLRQFHGMSGFPKRKESDCDAFHSGHSSMALSAALGMVTARDINHTDETIVAVIGDGALSGGMAYEALNNMARLRKEKKNLIIILNDNKMSIAENKKIKALMAWLNVHPEISHVVIAQHWSARYDSKNVMDWKLKPLPSGEPAYSNSLRAFISELRAMGKQVILLAPTPLIKQNDVAKYIRNLIRRGETGKGLESLTCTRQKYREDHAAVLPILDRLEQEGLCTVLRILPYIPEDRPFNAYEHGEILYKDSDHMSSKGSIKLFQHLKPQLKEALQKESTASSGLQKP